jgi:hypothetical protein
MSLSLLAWAAVAALGGCQFSHSFGLEEVRQVTPGETTKQDLDRIFGPRDFIVYTTYESWGRDQLSPPAPLSLVSWPVFLQTHDTRYEFTVHLDSRNVVASGELQIYEESSTNILFLFGPTDYTVHLGEEDLQILRELRKKVIDVKIALHPIRCFGGIIGWATVPLDEYLQRKD